jgi:CheY-like chemotaxis protein
VNFTALIVEDDTLQRATLADLLKDEGLEVIECTSAEGRARRRLYWNRAQGAHH